MGRFTKILKDKGMRNLASNKEVHQTVYRRSKEIFDRSKREMLRDFLGHPVTKEIKEGPEAANLSNTIVGPGNLYSFIGFENGANPISAVYNLLNFGTNLVGKRPRIVGKTKERIYLGFKIDMPSREALAKASPMPWEPGSWLFKVEVGMSGLGYYIYEKYIKGSRSGTGIQADGKVRTGLFRRTQYMSAILNKFKRNFTK